MLEPARIHPLKNDPLAEEKIACLCAYAKHHKISRQDLLATIARKKAPVGDIPEHTIRIGTGFRAVYSIEEQAIGWCDHLSISCVVHGRIPDIYEIQAIMAAFGLGSDLHDTIGAWWENDVITESGPVDAINILRQRSKNTIPED